jgi:hypothetical protein
LQGELALVRRLLFDTFFARNDRWAYERTGLKGTFGRVIGSCLALQARPKDSQRRLEDKGHTDRQKRDPKPTHDLAKTSLVSKSLNRKAHKAKCEAHYSCCHKLGGCPADS